MRAFSQVVADGRFSVLGLVMLGVLGGVCRVVGVVDGLEAEGQAEVERVLVEFGREAWGDGDETGDSVARSRGDGGEVLARVDAGEPVKRDDEGEVVAREEDGEDEGMADLDDGIAPTPAHTSLPKAKDEESDEDEITDTKVARKSSPSPPKVARLKSSSNSTKKRSADINAKSTDTKAKPAKKKRKKGGDAIDDLFSGW